MLLSVDIYVEFINIWNSEKAQCEIPCKIILKWSFYCFLFGNVRVTEFSNFLDKYLTGGANLLKLARYSIVIIEII